MTKTSGKSLSISEQVRVIKEVYPNISDNGIKAFLANIEAESGGKLVMENSYPHSQVFKKWTEEDKKKGKIPQGEKVGNYVQNVVTMRKNLTKLGFGEDASAEKIKEYNALNNQEKLGVMYQADKNLPGGGVGLLQFTTANYGGLKNRTKQLTDMGVDYKKFLSDPAYNLKTSLEYYKKNDPKFSEDQVNDIDPQSLGKKINPGRKQSTVNWESFTTSANNNFDKYSKKNKTDAEERQDVVDTEVEVDNSQRELEGSEESEQMPESSTVQNESMLDNVYRVYDERTQKYTKFSSVYNPDDKTWTHEAIDDEGLYTTDEVNEIGNMYNTLGATTPDGMNSFFREEEFADGNKFYKPYSSESGNEQTEFQKRFSFVDNKPAQLATDPKVIAKFSEIESERILQEQSVSLDKAEAERQQQKDPFQIDLEKAVADAEKTNQATQSPTSKYKLEQAQNKLDAYNQKLEKEKQAKVLPNLVSTEKRLREQLAQMQENAELFSIDEIKKVQLQIDKTAIDIAVQQGQPRAAGPFGNTTEQVKDVVITKEDLDEIKYVGEGDPVEIPKGPLDDVQTTDVQSVPGEYVEEQQPTQLGDVVIGSDDEEQEDKTDIDNKSLKTLSSIERGLGGATAIISGILGASAMRKATKPIEKDDLPQLSNAFLDYLEKNRELSKRGFSPAEEAQAKQDINASYKLGVENLIRGTAGDRAKFLAMSGQVDANRSRALLDFAVKDAQMNRVNLQNYGKTLSYKEEFDSKNTLTLRTEKINEQLRDKASAATFASEAFSNMLDEITYQRQYGPGSINHTIKERRLIDLYGVDADGNPVEDGVMLTDEEKSIKNKTTNNKKQEESLIENNFNVNDANNQLLEDKEVIFLNNEIENQNADDYAVNDGENSILTSINRT
tara:strand:- start:967 stop:3654 length:2688 start_codon:yes stop_codon:yes gene_type:complete